MKAHLYTTKYRAATDTKPETVEVYHDLMRRPVYKRRWQYGLRPADNHREAVHYYLLDRTGQHRIVASGTCLYGYWFAIEELA
jgi:hypothetical protein